MALKTESENTYSTGVDEVNRRIFFGCYLPNSDKDEATDFSKTSVEYAVRAIKKMESESKKPIELHVNSVGGDPYAMLYLYDVILSSPVQIKFFGGGSIMSAATWIMCACDERYLYPNASIMVHNGHLGVSDSVTDVEIAVEEDKRLNSLLEDIYARNSKMPKHFWTAICKRDTHLTAEEAILLGLADRIVEPKKRGNFRRIRQLALSESVSANKLKETVAKIYERIHIPIKMDKITINSSPTEEIDETLTVEDNKPTQGEIK